MFCENRINADLDVNIADMKNLRNGKNPTRQKIRKIIIYIRLSNVFVGIAVENANVHLFLKLL